MTDAAIKSTAKCRILEKIESLVRQLWEVRRAHRPPKAKHRNLSIANAEGLITGLQESGECSHVCTFYSESWSKIDGPTRDLEDTQKQ